MSELTSIKADPSLKILDVSTTIKQHGGEVLKQQQNLSAIRKSMEELNKHLNWQITAKDKLHQFSAANPDSTKWTEAQRAHIRAAEAQFLPEYQIQAKIQSFINDLDIPMRSLISVGNNLQRSSAAISAVANESLGDAVKNHLSGVLARPTAVPGLSLDTTKASPEQAAENEAKAEAASGLLDLGSPNS